jgi:hypothetical protein
MPSASELVDQAIYSVGRMRALLSNRRSQRQVRSRDERQLIKAGSLAWFNSTRAQLQSWHQEDELALADRHFRELLAFSDHEVSRQRYFNELTALKAALVALRGNALTATRIDESSSGFQPPPDFSPLVQDPAMQAILERRWNETGLCISAGADLAAIVMIGGLLEGLLLARLNLMPNQAPAFKASAAPRDKVGKTLPLKEWTLRNYIDVGYELKWISSSAKDVGAVVRDYRNYVHPAKELSHGISITPGDSQMLWAVFASLSQQLISSASTP